MKARMLVAAFLTLVAVTGCLSAEVQEIQVSIPPESSVPRYVITWRNLKTSEQSPESDFRDLLNLWKGDEYLLERAAQGVYVRDRSVTLDGESLVGREEGLVGRLTGVSENFRYGTSVVWVVSEDDSLEATNGTVTQVGDSTFVVWAPDAREFMVRWRVRNFRPDARLAQSYRDSLQVR